MVGNKLILVICPWYEIERPAYVFSPTPGTTGPGVGGNPGLSGMGRTGRREGILRAPPHAVGMEVLPPDR